MWTYQLLGKNTDGFSKSRMSVVANESCKQSTIHQVPLKQTTKLCIFFSKGVNSLVMFFLCAKKPFFSRSVGNGQFPETEDG